MATTGVPHRMSARQIFVIVLCAAVAMIDGMDTQVIGLLAPAIAADWQVSPVGFGLVFSGGLLAGTTGAFAFGLAADRFGRKPMLIFATLFFALGSLATAWVASMNELLLARVVTGFGLGGALPIIIAIGSETAPEHARTRIVAMMYSGFPLGSVLGGLATIHYVGTIGWEGIFILGGILPLVLAPFLAMFVPESDQFAQSKLRRAAASADSTYGAGPSERKGAVGDLFSPDLARGTILIWATLFLSLLLTVFLVNWMPLLVRGAGLDLRNAVLGVTVLNIGGILGGFLIGRFCDARASTLPIALAYAVGAFAIAALGVVVTSAPLLRIAAFAAGVLVVGAQMSAIAVSARLYPTAIRATGVGWAFGVGRIGAVVGPFAGGLLVDAKIAVGALFLIAALVALGAAAASAAIRYRQAPAA